MRMGALVVAGLAALVALFAAARFVFAPKPFDPYFTLSVTHRLSTLEAESKVAVPLERAAMQLEGVASVRTHVDADEVSITVGLKPGVPIDGVVFPAIEKLSAVETGAAPPNVVSTRENPSLTYLSLTSSTLPATELHLLAENVLRMALLRTPGVRDVEICGPGLPGVMISIDPTRLSGSISRLVEALQRSTVSTKTVHDDARGDFTVRVHDTGVEGLGDLEIGEGRRVKDVASIRDAPVDAPCRSTYDGQRGVGLLVRAAGEVPMPTTASLPPSVTSKTMKFDRVLHFASAASPEALEQMLARAFSIRHGIASFAYELRKVGGSAVATAYVALEHDRPASVMKLPGDPPLISVEGEPLQALQLAGPDLESLGDAAAEVKNALAQGGYPVISTAAPRVPETRIELDREALARASIDASEVSQSLELISDRGLEVTTLSGPNGGKPVHLKLEGQKLEDLATVRVGQGVPLAAIAKVTLGQQPAWIDREDGQRVVRLQTSASAAQVREVLKTVPLPAGVVVRIER